MKDFFKFTYVSDLDKIRVESDSPELFAQLLDVYTTPNPQFFFLQQRGVQHADEFLSAISSTGTFNTGMFIPIHKTALSIVKGDKTKIVIDNQTKNKLIQLCKPLNGVFDKEYEIVELDETRSLRYYQHDALKKLIEYGRGICISPTASGKSYIIGNLINILRENINKIDAMKDRKYFLLIVPTRQLVDQMFTDLQEYGLKDICRWTSNSGKKRNGTFIDNSCSDGFSNVIITNHDWINKEIANKNEDFPFDEIGCVIADEVHTISPKTEMRRNLLKINPPLRFGFTGTMPKLKYNSWSIIGDFGIPVYCAEIKKFQDEGFLSKLEIYPIKIQINALENNRDLLYSIKHKARLGDRLPDGTIVDTGTAFKMENEFFEVNASELYGHVFDAVKPMFDFEKQNMIVLFDRINIGKSIYNTLVDKFKDKVKVHYMDGSIDVSIRENIRKELESTNGNILVAQAVTASVGLNIKNLNGILFAFAGKSFVRVIQSIGRVIRLKNNKSISKLFEVFFNTRYSDQHHREKMNIFKENYGSECIMGMKVVKI